MVCIYCGNETEVTNSRAKARLPSVWRRRQCKSCVAQFSTLEQADYQTALSVGRNDSKHVEPFQRDKLFMSIFAALGHRQDALASATALTQTVISALLPKKIARPGLIEASTIAKQTWLTVKRFDPLAANTYKAYHRESLK